MIKHRAFKGVLCATALAIASFAAHADLARVGPLNVPSPAGHGFPLWYQDLNGLALDLCLPDAADPGGLQGLVCLMETAPPYTFPSAFPGESFYFRATTPGMDMPGGKSAVLVLGLEATFNGGVPAANDQVTFTRIRVTAGVPEAGIYTVTHPYGTNTFDVTTVGTGNRDIVFTEDVGIATGSFTGALKSRVGPFLVAADPATGVALPPVTINGAKFLADIAPVAITGSPFNTNYFQICGKRADGTDIILGGFGPSGTCAMTPLFTLTGRVHDLVASPIGSPLAVNAATYSRDAAGTHVNVSASVGRALASQPVPLLTAASTQTPPVRLVGPDVLDRYFTQGFTDPSGTLPGPITVTNSGDNPPTSVRAATTDVVTILSTGYDGTAQTLTVNATSSDKGFAAQLPPALALEGLAFTAAPCAASADPACRTLVASGVAVPPATVIVQSAAGGIGRADLQTNPNLAYAAGSPFTQDDTVSVAASSPALLIPVLANDVAHAAAPINPASLTVLAPGLAPNLGTLVNNGDGTVSFTSNGQVGSTSFKYTVSSAAVAGASNVATVTINVTEPVGGFLPLAANDGPIPVLAGRAVAINVLANDSGNGGTLNPASVTIVPGSVTGGTAAVNTTTGVVTFTAGATAGANFGFDYTVANTNGNVGSPPAHVTVNVLASEPIAVAAGAECRRSTNRWRVSGTGVTPNTSITLYRTATAPAAPTAAQIVATVPVDALGAWVVDTTTGGACTTTSASVRTQAGTVRNNITIRIR
ncbi:Glycoprotein gp2 [Rubrivivax sp. A210]|uniref:Ig-like domain-containing protein n=1 Tax=Rubrivivax sp. A210 TaxID=2772301 RepID=UPI0019192D4E|nr:Ig-like domain-containing protein [Rubrivivax sp. A210]CAD5374002.1 Glycoprotein gp2 [Rubrivivax sp. A210]